MEYGECLSTTSHDDISLTSLQHLSAENQSIGSRRTGGGYGGVLTKTAKELSYLTGIVATAMIIQTRQMVIGRAHLSKVALRDIHPSHCRARDQDDLQR